MEMNTTIKKELNSFLQHKSGFVAESKEGETVRAMFDYLHQWGVVADGCHCREDYSLELTSKRKVYRLMDENGNTFDNVLVLSTYWGSAGRIEINAYVS